MDDNIPRRQYHSIIMRTSLPDKGSLRLQSRKYKTVNLYERTSMTQKNKSKIKPTKTNRITNSNCMNIFIFFLNVYSIYNVYNTTSVGKYHNVVSVHFKKKN